MDALLNYLCHADIDIACICETWLSDKVCDAELSHSGRFSVFRRDRGDGRGGGVLILVKSALTCVEFQLPATASELVAADVVVGDQKVRFVCVYFSPTGDSRTLLTRMEQLISDLVSLTSDDCTILINGDLNLPSINWETLACPGVNGVSKESMFLDFLGNNGLTQHVKDPTRPRSGNILDLLITSGDNISDVVVHGTPVKSDHLAISYSVEFLENQTPKRTAGFSYNKGDFESIRLNLQLTDWYVFFGSCDSIDSMYDKLTDYLHFLRELHVPLKDYCSADKMVSAIGRLSEKINVETDAVKLAKLQRDLDRCSLRQRLMEESNIVKSTDKKKFHQYVSRRLKSRDQLSAIRRSDGSLATDDGEKAGILQTHFAKTYPDEGELRRRELRPQPPVPIPDGIDILEDVDTSPEHLYVHLKNLKTKWSSTPDDLPCGFLKKIGYEICKPLSLLFRRSLEEGQLPQIFHHAIVCPVHKKGDRANPENKRPVSLTCVSCKLFESVIVKSIYESADRQNLIYAEQFAYRPGFSTTLQLLCCQTDWALMANSATPFDVVYFDYKSAFESVTHSKLVKVLPSFGIGNKIVKWIQAFLDSRSFSVKVNDSYAVPSPVSSGCPQGTLLGCLMYLLYTDSLKFAIPTDVSVRVYADDVKMYKSIENEDDSAVLQDAISCLKQWSDSLDLTLSIGKCMVEHYGYKNRRFKYKIDDVTLSVKSVVKDLGVYMSDDFKFTEHCRQVALKANRTCNFILRAFVVKNVDIYVKLFEIYVMPILRYASCVWYPRLKKDSAVIERIQKRYFRRVRFRCNTDTIERPDLLKVLDQCDIKMLEKIMNDNRFADIFFKISKTCSRRGHVIQPPCIATNEIVNNLFSWRVCRLTR